MSQNPTGYLWLALTIARSASTNRWAMSSRPRFPDARAALGYPLLVGDVRGIITIEVRNQVNDPTTLTQPFG